LQNEFFRLVQEFHKSKNNAQIKKLIETFSTQYCVSKDPHKRKGGLIALASCAIALGSDCNNFINELLTPVLNCLLDPDTRVRYFASESLYNIVKISRQAIIPMFPEIFSALSRLVADPDVAVKNASELLDRLLKDIITENSQIFDLVSFVPLLRERVLTKNSFARQFLISWIAILNAVPEINMLHFLPDILDGIFQMLEDQMFEIQRMCETLLLQFLKNIKHDPSTVDLPKMTNILILHAQNANNELIQLTAITWLREFLNISGVGMLSYSSGIFSAILPCLSYEADSKKSELHNLRSAFIQDVFFSFRHQRECNDGEPSNAGARFVKSEQKCRCELGPGVSHGSAENVSRPQLSVHEGQRPPLDPPSVLGSSK
jgi:vacuole morphology and inheritance protein 14